MNEIEKRATEVALARFKLAGLSPEAKAALVRHVLRPAQVGAGIGGAYGLYRGAKDVLNDDDIGMVGAFTHPLGKGLEGVLKGVPMGVAVNAGNEGLKRLLKFDALRVVRPHVPIDT